MPVTTHGTGKCKLSYNPGMRFSLKCIMVLVCLVGIAAAQPSNRIVIQTSTILDGKGGVLHNQQIVIEGSRISPSMAAPTLCTVVNPPCSVIQASAAV